MKRLLVMARIILSRRMTCWYLSPIIAFGTVAFILVFRSLLLTTGQELHIAAGGGSTAIAVSLLASAITALATCFPLATAVGITRCDVVLGNLLHHLQAVVYNTLLLAGMLVLEGATGGWFINQPIFGTGLLDHGSWFTFWWFTPLSLLAAMAMGASVAAAWLWRGTLGLLLHAATTMAIFMTTLWLISLCWDWARFAAHFNAGWLAGSLALVTVLALTGTAALIRRASVRGS